MSLVFFNRSKFAGVNYIGLSLICLHLFLIFKLTGRQDQFLLSVLFWWIISVEIRRKNLSRKFIYAKTKTWLGGALTIVLVISSFLLSVWSNSHSWIRFYPLFAWLSWVLITSQIKNKESWSELKLIVLMILPHGYISELLRPLIGLKLQILLAATSNFILHYIGFISSRDDINLILENGRVTVEYGCAGMPLLLLLIQLMFLFSTDKNLTISQYLHSGVKIGVLFMILTSARIAMLALVVNRPDYFDYWHSQQGAGWFSVAAISIVFFSERRIVMGSASKHAITSAPARGERA